MTAFTTRSIEPTDYPDWKPLFYGYAEFYETAIDDTIADSAFRGQAFRGQYIYLRI